MLIVTLRTLEQMLTAGSLMPSFSFSSVIRQEAKGAAYTHTITRCVERMDWCTMKRHWIEWLPGMRSPRRGDRLIDRHAMALFHARFLIESSKCRSWLPVCRHLPHNANTSL